MTSFAVSLALQPNKAPNFGGGEEAIREVGRGVEAGRRRRAAARMTPPNLTGQFGDTTYTKVFVGGLAWETQTETMRKYFEQFGEILEAVVITDKNTGRSKGYGFVSAAANSQILFCVVPCFPRRSHLLPPFAHVLDTVGFGVLPIIALTDPPSVPV